MRKPTDSSGREMQVGDFVRTLTDRAQGTVRAVLSGKTLAVEWPSRLWTREKAQDLRRIA
jgi:hypothetical protein